jgi:tetraacyldisaccharide 4'-kinase
MVRNYFIKLLLWPFSLLYGTITGLRNALYETEILKSAKFGIPIISIGNLSVGGAGKTPLVEYLIRLLKDYVQVGVLSRGYNRTTRGFRLVKSSDDAAQAGDEPLMYAKKYDDIVVSVCESRATGIPEMVKRYPGLQTILLDDAFQHRSVMPDINILLTEFSNPYSADFLMPVGRLREGRSNAERADIVIVSKCPEVISQDVKKKMINDLKLLDYQSVYFTRYNYGIPYSFYNPNYVLDINKVKNLLLVTAIASTKYLMEYLNKFDFGIKNMEYEDHRYFSPDDIANIVKVYKSIPEPESKILLTTEKDATRLALYYNKLVEEKINLFVLPVRIEFLFDDNKRFENEIKERLLEIEK